MNWIDIVDSPHPHRPSGQLACDCLDEASREFADVRDQEARRSVEVIDKPCVGSPVVSLRERTLAAQGAIQASEEDLSADAAWKEESGFPLLEEDLRTRGM